MLEVVDAELGGLGVGDGAEVAGDLEVELMRFVDGGLQLVAGDVHVGLEAGDTLRGPEADGLAGVVGVAEVVHLQEGRVGAFEVGAGDVHVRAGEVAGVDLAAEVEVGVGLDAAGGAEGGDAGGEVHARCREGHLGDDQRWLTVAERVEVGAGDVVHVVVHADQAGDDGVAVEVEDFGVGSGWEVFRDAGDLAVFDEDGLVFEGGGAGAVDDADVGEESPGAIDSDEFGDCRGRGLCVGDGGGGEADRQGGGAATVHGVLLWGEFTRDLAGRGDFRAFGAVK